MRKLSAFLLCVILLLCLYACQNSQSPSASGDGANYTPTFNYVEGTVFRFPEGTVIYGVDLSGRIGMDAYTKLSAAVENYTLDLTINDRNITVTPADMGLQFDKALMRSYIDALKSGEDPSQYIPITYNINQLQYWLAYRLNIPAGEVGIVYDPDVDSFVFVDAEPGVSYELEPVMEELKDVVGTLTTQYTTTAQVSDLEPIITANSSSAQKMLKEANKHIENKITYAYTPDGSRSTYVPLTPDDIGSFLIVNSDNTLSVNKDVVLAYAERMAEQFTVGDNDGKFLTSHGEYIDFNITYADQAVDAQALADDIAHRVEHCISGEFEAPYLKKGKGWTYDLGGSYVEIDLTAQRLWVYKDYECKLYTNIVTGNLSEEWDTPTGIFKVYQRIYPTRPGRVFRYWMPFLGAYGLHDANWRSEFRSDEYLYEGSHGCVNIPPENFLLVYEHVSVGTPVVIYGGASNGNPVTQEITGTTEYNVGVKAGTFALDVTPKYGERRYLSYVSDNPNVVSVYDDGTVKVRATGTANITVTSYDWSFCPSTEIVVTINVHEDCSETGHTIVNWKTVKAATCRSLGIEEGTCTSCDYTEKRNTPLNHDFYFAAYMHPQSWVVTKWPTCSEPGEKYRTCEKCGFTEVAEVPVEEHIPVCWEITKEATETTAGEMVGHCYFCGLEEKKEIPPLSN